MVTPLKKDVIFWLIIFLLLKRLIYLSASPLMNWINCFKIIFTVSALIPKTPWYIFRTKNVKASTLFWAGLFRYKKLILTGICSQFAIFLTVRLWEKIFCFHTETFILWQSPPNVIRKFSISRENWFWSCVRIILNFWWTFFSPHQIRHWF